MSTSQSLSTARPSFAAKSQMALDKIMLAATRGKQRDEAHYSAEQTGAELATAARIWAENDWLADPRSYHRTPPAVRGDEMTVRGDYRFPRRHQLITYPSGFSPREFEPGAARFAEHPLNGTAWVRVLRHKEDRPWVVIMHGFGMGNSRMDIRTLWAVQLHFKFGYNVAVPVMPLHGPRNVKDGDQMLSLDLMSALHGVTQAVWDARRLIGWIRANSSAPVGVLGVSLGGFVAALIAGVEPVDSLISGIPIVDVPGLMSMHEAPPGYAEVLAAQTTRDVFRVVSPLAIGTIPAGDHRALFAAQYDQFIPHSQSVALQQAWSDSATYWAPKGHVGCIMSKRTRSVVTDFFSATL